jgi:hypothetical protein
MKFLRQFLLSKGYVKRKNHFEKKKYFIIFFYEVGGPEFNVVKVWKRIEKTTL